jgi:ubiquinone/menaquinone biosynthesis C-methylase UbiE
MTGAGSALLGNVDEPSGEVTFSAWIRLRGWVFAQSGKHVTLRVTAGGRSVAEFSPGEDRPDVAAVHAGSPHAARSGFDTYLPKSRMPDEPHFVLRVEAFTDDASAVLAQIPVTWVPESSVCHARGDYRDVWNRVATSYEEARISVCGTADLNEYDESGTVTAEAIRSLTGIQPSDTVLEIGCGTGRIARHLAAHCGRWIGADVSTKMLDYAKEALKGFPNVEWHVLTGSDLHGFADASLDVVYSSAVFMHLEEWDRWRYVSEMYRVLRPGGRAYYDNFNLLGDQGWDFFLAMSRLDPINRPANISKSSTPQELERYALQAGFEILRIIPNRLWVQLAALKPPTR